MNCPTAVADSLDAARAVVETLGARRAPALTCWLGDAGGRVRGGSSRTARSHLRDAGRGSAGVRAPRPLPAEPGTPDGDATLRVRPHRRRSRKGREAIIDAVVEDGRTLLTELEAKDLLGAFGIPTVETVSAATLTRNTGGRAPRLPGRAQDPVARHLPQVRYWRCRSLTSPRPRP